MNFLKNVYKDFGVEELINSFLINIYGGYILGWVGEKYVRSD